MNEPSCLTLLFPAWAGATNRSTGSRERGMLLKGSAKGWIPSRLWSAAHLVIAVILLETPAFASEPHPPESSQKRAPLAQSVPASTEIAQAPEIGICGLPESKRQWISQPNWKPLLTLTQCLAYQTGANLHWLDSLANWIPDAPGFWNPQLEQWTRQPVSEPSPITRSPLALPLALGLLPDLGAQTWRTLGEQSLMRGDSAAALVFWMRQAASDSLQQGYDLYRFTEFFRKPTPAEDESARNVRAQERQHAKQVHSWVKGMSAPARWQTQASLALLEQALWKTDAPDLALDILRKRLTHFGAAHDPASWTAAAWQLWNAGKPLLARQALEEIELGTLASGNAKPVDSVWKPQALELALKLSTVLDAPTFGSRWAKALQDGASEIAHSVHSHRLDATKTQPLAIQGLSRSWPGSPLQNRFENMPVTLTSTLSLQAAEACLSTAEWSCFQAWGKDLQGHANKRESLDAERFQLLSAYALVGQGQVSQARKIVDKLKQSSHRQLSNGAVLNAQAWLEAYAEHWHLADSLWAIATAYLDEPWIMTALDMRRLILLDTAALGEFTKARLEAPYPISQKRQRLNAISPGSKLWGEAQWLAARYALGAGEWEKAKQHWTSLAEKGHEPKSLQARVALARLAEVDHPGQAIAGFEDLLVESQQGPAAELARERLRALEN